MQLKEYLKSKNMTVEAFIDELGIVNSTFYGYVQGARKMPLELAARIIRHTEGHVTIDDLLEFQKKKKSQLEDLAS